MKKRGICLVLSVVFILAGAVYYYLFCPDVFFVKRIDEFLGGGYHLGKNSVGNGFVMFLRFYLMDFLWAASLCLALSFILEISVRSTIFGVCATIILGAVLEIMQLTGIAAGTFDIWDIVSEALGAAAGTLIIHMSGGRK